MQNTLGIVISGIEAQNVAITSIAENIANIHSDTYKRIETAFEPLISPSINSGVRPYKVRTIDIQGHLYNTGIETNIAIDGPGMFAVANDIDNDEVLFTRLGSFASDKDGYLVNGEGAILKGWKLDKNSHESAKIIPQPTDSLENINLSNIGVAAKATTRVEINMNLDARDKIPKGAEYEIKLNSPHNINNSLNDIIYPDNIKEGDGFTVTTSYGNKSKFIYGGFAKSNVILQESEILGAKDITSIFTALTDGNQFIINNDISGDSIFTYSRTNPDPNIGQFNNMENLCDAINSGSEYSARIIDNQLYVTPKNLANIINFKNVTKENKIGTSSSLNSIYEQDLPRSHLNSFIADSSSPIYSATNANKPFTKLPDNSKLNITLSNGKKHTFTFTTKPNVTDGSFNSLKTLSEAINYNSTPELKSYISNNNQIKIEVDKNNFPDLQVMSCNGDNNIGANLGIEINSVFKEGINQGDKFEIVSSNDSINNTRTTELTFLRNNPDITKGEFNDLVTLVKAINTLGQDELNAQITDEGTRIKIEPINSKILYINDIKGNVTEKIGLHNADIVSALGMKSTVIPPKHFGTFGQLSNLIEKEQGINSHKNQNTISISADKVLSTINFANLEGSDNILSVLGISDDVVRPSYNPLDDKKNMSSGLIKPSFSNSVRIYDSFGTSHELQTFFIKLEQNKWGVEISANPNEIQSTRTDGLLAYANLIFNGDGTIRDIDFTGINSDEKQLVKIAWTNQADDSKISFDLGIDHDAQHDNLTPINGIRQLSTKYTLDSFEQDGHEVGVMKRINIDEHGIITGVFSNGSTRKIYQIPVVTFPNINGLETVAHNIYSMGKHSGNYSLKVAGQGSAGHISSQTLEGSNVTISDQITKIIKTKHASQINSKLMQTADKLFEEISRIISI
ncbi:MAG: flagellar hook-basal body complex protein [Rickettsiaceae bacterium H1]|nr:flagellar hook-basal body complex protein [Rickettsiaceae bacterium H1]